MAPLLFNPVDLPSSTAAVLDTNVFLDLISNHDLRIAENAAYQAHGLKGLRDPDFVYRLARARSATLLAWYLHTERRATLMLQAEPLNLLRKRVPPGQPSHELQFLEHSIYFLMDRVLPDWDAKCPTTAETEEGTAVDDLLLDAAKRHHLPLITNEGYTATGIIDKGLRKKAKDAGVDVYTPEEFYRGKINEPAAAKAFLQRFQQQRPFYVADRERLHGRDKTGEVLDAMFDIYRAILLPIDVEQKAPIHPPSVRS